MKKLIKLLLALLLVASYVNTTFATEGSPGENSEVNCDDVTDSGRTPAPPETNDGSGETTNDTGSGVNQ